MSTVMSLPSMNSVCQQTLSDTLDLLHSSETIADAALIALHCDAISKTLAALAVFIIAVAAAAVPIHIARSDAALSASARDDDDDEHDAGSKGHSHYHIIVQYGNAFSAGIFLAMCVVHLLPEASRSFGRAAPEWNQQYRPAELLCICGYAFILALQRVVFPTPTCPHAVSSSTEAPHSPHHHHHHPTRESRDRCQELGELQGAVARLVADSQTARAQSRSYGTLATLPSEGTAGQELANDAKPLAERSRGTHATSSQHIGCCRSAKHCVVEEHSVANSHNGGSFSSATPALGDDVDSKVTGGPAHLLLDRSERMASPSGGWTLMFALSLHAVCEGLALGLQCGLQSVAVLAGAICAHKWAESFALSSSLMHEATEPQHHHHHGHPGDHVAESPRSANGDVLTSDSVAMARAQRIIGSFSLATPCGTLIGALMHSQLPLSSVGVVKALSAGTLLYMGASEVVVEEFVQGRQYWGKWFCFLLGVAVMYGLTVRFH